MSKKDSTHEVSIQTVAQGFHSLKAGDDSTFNGWATAVMTYQRLYNPVVEGFKGYTYLPVQAFKLTEVCSFDPSDAEIVFESSATTSPQRAKHYVLDLSLYERSVLTGFDQFWESMAAQDENAIRDYAGTTKPLILGHLPHYADRSSLVYMVQLLINERGAQGSSFFLDDIDILKKAIDKADIEKRPILLFGAAFGLLDLLEKEPIQLPDQSVILETGGMKTHRREVDRESLHNHLSSGFGLAIQQIRSEYGMCELMSQCYSGGDGLFRTPPWMRFAILDPMDPLREVSEGNEGVLALMDLANCWSASAVLTEDRAIRRGDGFHVLGRLSGAELRGCNFLMEDMNDSH
ncbi:MAG: acyl transferase [Bacteroidetes bacterium]|nr:acyl transferase [Bacteroidota bacterium]